MQAIIIAAGESSRFWPVNQGHKSQIKILGKSLIYWTIKGLSEIGIKDIVLVVSPSCSFKEELTADLVKLGINISWAVQEKPLGTGDAIFRAKDFIKEPFLVFWPYKVNAREIGGKILEKYEREKPQAIFVGAKTATPWDYGIFKFTGDKVVEIFEKVKPGQEPSDIKILGTYFLQPDFFDYYQRIKKHHPQDFIDTLNLYLKDKEAKVIILDKDPPALKYPWEVLHVLKIMLESEALKQYISPKASIGQNVVIEGQVYIGDNVSVGSGTVISGPCFIGDNCKLGASNVLRGPVNLERDVVTGALTEIKDCLIEKGTHLHSGYFGDSVIGENCRFGADFTTANRRIDRNNIHSLVKGKKINTGLTYFGTVIGNNTCFGIKSGTMPGILIGSGCCIGPGTLVFENLEDNKTLYTKFTNEKS